MTEDQYVDKHLATLGFKPVEKSGWCPVRDNWGIPPLWMAKLGIGWWWVGLKRYIKGLFVPLPQWASRITYHEDVGFGGTPRTILAEYDGGGAWRYTVTNRDGTVVVVKENDYESINHYIRTGKATYIPQKCKGPEVTFDGNKLDNGWRAISLGGSEVPEALPKDKNAEEKGAYLVKTPTRPGWVREYIHSHMSKVPQESLDQLDAEIAKILILAPDEDIPLSSFMEGLDEGYKRIVDEAEEAYKKAAGIEE
jgi:hypothetical protein